ncbi:hypothetical protein CHH38_18945 [Acinetobacter nosocomialis]|uniref:hypothetical protein n=1 Tax=Acinetobacter TaxID=469 RepID=UPI00073D9EC8|nr:MULTISPECIES: hypothetical protein [Acinetobacter]ALV71928.1 hypothetical protein RZ95_02745 [Acinetobacter johnsonii XBB1]MCV2452719.1 hypothetical protein [Acinetobacter johnsonii]MDH1532437.1 hypothetical protein [Acinetobacter johnsonii]PHM79557.1 hypothetical protein CHH38_18945 [Acinetobacter nosocomialis]
MKLKDAFDYILDKNNTLSNFNAYMIGVVYEDKDSFLFVNLSIDDEEIENNMLYYHAHVTSGKIGSSEGEEDFYSAESIEDLLAQLPLIASYLSYHVYKLDEDVLGLSSEYALKALFPRLPDPDFHDLDDFKVEAIKLVSTLNY